jgi:hypothetical protein
MKNTSELINVLQFELCMSMWEIMGLEVNEDYRRTGDSEIRKICKIRQKVPIFKRRATPV